MDAYRIAYDGRPYHGFQRQPSVATVSGAILDALGDLDVVDGGVPPGYAAAGRTDAGVSAVEQTVAFAAPEWLGPTALNGALPAAVTAWARADAPPDFHATRDATARTYTYYLHAPGADTDRARRAAGTLDGHHDYHNLTPDETGTVRDVSIDVHRDGAMLVIRVRADGFPRQFVRRLVAAIEAIATGTAAPDLADRILAPEPLSGPAGIAPAAPEPLVLTAVAYPELSFTVDDAAAEQARATFDARRAAAEAAAAVCEELAALGTAKRQRLGDGGRTRDP